MPTHEETALETILSLAESMRPGVTDAIRRAVSADAVRESEHSHQPSLCVSAEDWRAGITVSLERLINAFRGQASQFVATGKFSNDFDLVSRARVVAAQARELDRAELAVANAVWRRETEGEVARLQDVVTSTPSHPPGPYLAARLALARYRQSRGIGPMAHVRQLERELGDLD
jgi:hypothetical protein